MIPWRRELRLQPRGMWANLSRLDRWLISLSRTSRRRKMMRWTVRASLLSLGKGPENKAI